MPNKTKAPEAQTPTHANPDKAFTQQLRVRLTDNEITALARDLADAQNKADQEHENKKRALAEFNARLKAFAAESSRLAITVTSGYTFREVACAQYFDWPAKGRKSTFRLDTEECISEEEMTTVDRQLSLPINPDGTLLEEEQVEPGMDFAQPARNPVDETIPLDQLMEQDAKVQDGMDRLAKTAPVKNEVKY